MIRFEKDGVIIKTDTADDMRVILEAIFSRVEKPRERFTVSRCHDCGVEYTDDTSRRAACPACGSYDKWTHSAP